MWNTWETYLIEVINKVAEELTAQVVIDSASFTYQQVHVGRRERLLFGLHVPPLSRQHASGHRCFVTTEKARKLIPYAMNWYSI